MTRGQRVLAKPLGLALFTGLWLVAPGFVAPAAGQDATPDPAQRQIYFGEQHLHTMNSPDAFAFGTRNTPDEAYRFCKGEAIEKVITGEMVQKSTPYDWCAVTDHSEYMGMMPLLLQDGHPLQDSPIGDSVCGGYSIMGPTKQTSRLPVGKEFNRPPALVH